jgi:hypothetical protein
MWLRLYLLYTLRIHIPYVVSSFEMYNVHTCMHGTPTIAQNLRKITQMQIWLLTCYSVLSTYSVQEQCSRSHGQNQPKLKPSFSTKTVWIVDQWNGIFVVSTRGETNLWALYLGLTSGPHPTLRVSFYPLCIAVLYVRLNAIIQKIGPSRSLSITWDTHNRGREKSSGPSHIHCWLQCHWNDWRMRAKGKAQLNPSSSSAIYVFSVICFKLGVWKILDVFHIFGS